MGKWWNSRTESQRLTLVGIVAGLLLGAGVVQSGMQSTNWYTWGLFGAGWFVFLVGIPAVTVVGKREKEHTTGEEGGGFG